MKSIIETLFYDTIERPLKNEETKISAEESKAYEILRENLTNEQKKLFLKYDDIKNERHLAEEKDIYLLGFQTGAQTLLEMLNLRFTK